MIFGGAADVAVELIANTGLRPFSRNSFMAMFSMVLGIA